MKIYTIERHSRCVNQYTGTLTELIELFSYTLEIGQDYEHERGNKKINRNPRTIHSLILNLNNAQNNASKNGYSGVWYKNIT